MPVSILNELLSVLNDTELIDFLCCRGGQRNKAVLTLLWRVQRNKKDKVFFKILSIVSRVVLS